MALKPTFSLSFASFQKYLWISCAFFFLFWLGVVVFHNLFPPLAFSFPKDKDLHLQLKGSLDIDFESLVKELQDSRYEFDIFLKAKALSPHRPAYRCYIEKLLIEKEGDTFFFYEVLPHQKVRYQSSRALSPSVRKKIFDFFSLNLENTDLTQDQSLLKKPFTWHFSEKGGLGLIHLNLPFKRALSKVLEGSLFQAIVEELIESSDKLITLLPPSWSTLQWESKGELFTPLKWLHEKKGPQSYQSLGTPFEKKKWTPPTFLYDFTLLHNQWKLLWEHRESQIKSIDGHWNFGMENHFLNKKVQCKLLTHFTLNFQFVSPRPTIQELAESPEENNDLD